MRISKQVLCLFFLCCSLVWAQPGPDLQDLPESLKQALSQADQVKVFSISPEPESPDSGFFGYPIFGQVRLTGPEAREVCGEVLKGLESASLRNRANCFAPRHALELPGGYRLLICYACHSVLTEDPEGQKDSFAIVAAGNEELARVVLENRLPWQGWARVGGLMRYQSGLVVEVPKGYSFHGSPGMETLFLDGIKQAEQKDAIPGELVLRSPDGTEETVKTQWIDHSESVKTVWYLVGIPVSFEAEGNRLICRGESYQLGQLKDYFQRADRPAFLSPRIRITPVDDTKALQLQEHRFRKNGYQLQPVKFVGLDFQGATLTRLGITTRARVGIVKTPLGDVLVTSEIPVGWDDPSEGLVTDLLEYDKLP